MKNRRGEKMSKIAIDIDNTLCDTSAFFAPLAKKYDREVLHKNNVMNYDKIIVRSDDWTKEELMTFVKNYFNKEVINVPVKEGASLYINKLKELGFEIIFITYRGTKEGDHSDLIIPDYLKKNNIPYDRIITRVTDKYTYLQKCEYFIDDDIINCEQAIEKTNCKVIMMSTPKTKGYTNSNISIVNNWQEVYEIISNQRN